jgi:hypothetical protein
MAGNSVKNKKCFRRHLELSHHLQHFIYSIRNTTYQKVKTFHSALVLYFLKNIIFHIKLFRHFEL